MTTEDLRALTEQGPRVVMVSRADMLKLLDDLADARVSVIAFGGPAMVEYAKERGLPPGHLFAGHYDILERAGARMTSFTRAAEPQS